VAAPVRRLWRTEYGALFLETDRDLFDEQSWWIPERWPGLQDILVWHEMELVPALPPAPEIARDDAHRVSRLMGSYVNDPEGLPLGRIVDVVIDMNRQQVHYAVLRLQGPLDVPPNQAFAVPVQSLAFSSGGEHATLAVPQTRVISLVGTDPDHGPPVDELRYLGTIDRPFSVAFPRVAGPAVGATR
jgi:sporulation protein YlmC with PRC-barrel domain